MYPISDETLAANQFELSGTVTHRSPIQFDMTFDARRRPSFVVYIMRVNGEVVKCGKAAGTYPARVKQEFQCLRDPSQVPRGQKGCTVMKAGTWATAADDFHRYGVPALRTPGTVVEVFAASYATKEEMLAVEDELNNYYRGLWTQEGQPGWTPHPRPTVSTLRLGERQAAV